MATMLTMRIKRQGHISAAEILAELLDDETHPITLVAVVPVMLTFFATAPHRYEVTELDAIVIEKDI